MSGTQRSSQEARGNRGRLRYVAFLIAFTLVLLVAINAFYTTRFHRIFVEGDSIWPEGSWRFHETIGFEMTPGFSAPMTDNSFYVKTHRLGYRLSREQDQETVEPGGILAVGCSFTYGDEVEAEQAFPALLGRALDMPVYNFGVGSYSYVSVIRQLEYLSQKGTLDILHPSIVLLGAGDWLVDRSLSPLFPTGGLPYGYPYITGRGGELTISDPPEAYAIKHFFALRTRYFPDDVVDERMTASRFFWMFMHTPRIFVARSVERLVVQPTRRRINSADLYDYVIPRIADYAERLGATFVVLWMPMDDHFGLDSGLRAAIGRPYLLVDGQQALRERGVDSREYVGRHPQAPAHEAYAEHLAAALTRAGVSVANP